MFEIRLAVEIAAPAASVWDVIVNTDDYPLWNCFIPECTSTFVPGSPIRMKVRILPSMLITQTETIRRVEAGRLIEYGIQLPLGLLTSSRKHLLTPIGQALTRYESRFRLAGLLSYPIGWVLREQLRRGFTDMTGGIAGRSLSVYASR